MSKRKILFIVNPASAGGRTLERWQAVIPKLEQAHFQYDTRFTEKAGCGTRITKEAIASHQYDTLISVGGDGTANEVVNGIMASLLEQHPLPAFTIFPSGTGSDAVRTLGIPKDLDGFIKMVETNDLKKIDVGRATFIAADGTKGARFFLNACDVGIGATVAHTVNTMNQEKKSGKAKYFRSIMEQVFKFKAFDADFIASEQYYQVDKTVIIAICNGMFFGGGVKISPVSKMDDGMLELFATTNVSKLRLLEIVSKVYSGAHVGHPKVKFQRDQSFEITLKKPQLLETDGEVCGVVKDVQFEVLPLAIQTLY